MNAIYQDTLIEKKLANRIFLEKLNECEKFPKYIMIEPIDICNACCTMCNIGMHMNDASILRGGIMTMELFEKIICQIQPYSEWIEMISMYGRGESLLDPNLELKIKRLKEIGIKKIQLSTNTSLLSGERIEALFKNGLNDLRISIDSVRKKVFEKIRKGLTFEQVLENTESAIRIRNEKFPNIPIRIRAVDLPENLDEREEWLKFWQDRISDIDTAQFIAYTEKVAGKMGDVTLNWPCISPFSTLIIRSKGQINLCCADTIGEMEMGNILDDSIIRIWQGDKFRTIRRMHLEGIRDKIPMCRGCSVWRETK